jgi:hypothetical protein
VRFAELTSGVGAAVLSLGLGVLAAEPLRGFGAPIAIVGLILHAWGMTDKHRMAAGSGAARAWWESIAYWACWLLLGALALFMIARGIGK